MPNEFAGNRIPADPLQINRLEAPLRQIIPLNTLIMTDKRKLDDTIANGTTTSTKATKLDMQPTTLKQFEEVFPSLVEDITKETTALGTPQQALEWFQRSLKYNAVGGKCNRGLSVPDTAQILSSAPLSPEQFKDTITLGWMTELLQAFFLVSDDIMDASHTRRGQPCWFRRPEVGMVAINDAFLLESAIYILLKKQFRSHSAYLDLIELFHDITFKTEVGQMCDLLTAPEDHVDLNNFSQEKVRFIVIYKTAFYSFYLPVVLALYYLELATPKNLEQAKKILIPTGEYFQAQDDYLDAYADPEVLGKIGTDIQDNKCSWLINQALPKCTPEQRKILDENYGRKDSEKEKKVKEVFHELKLDQLYHEYEERTVGEIRSMISELDESEGLKKEVFEVFLNKIYKRSK